MMLGCQGLRLITPTLTMYPDLKVAVSKSTRARSLAVLSSLSVSTLFRSSLTNGCLGLTSNVLFWLA